MMQEEIIRLYEAYIKEFQQQDKTRKPFEGVFGFRGGPQDYPCHEKFMQDLDEALKRQQSQNPSSIQTAGVLRYIYCEAPVRWESEGTAYWMLIAAQSLTLEMIANLGAADAQALCGEYEKQYPRRQRLPVQDKILKALKARSKAR